MVNSMYDIAIAAPLYAKIVYGSRNFLILKQDDNLKVNNMICLREFENDNYTGRFMAKAIKHIVMGNKVDGLVDGYCVISW